MNTTESSTPRPFANRGFRGPSRSSRSFSRIITLLSVIQIPVGTGFSVVSPGVSRLPRPPGARPRAQGSAAIAPLFSRGAVVVGRATRSASRRAGELLAEAVPATQAEPVANQEQGFQWRRQWYPVAVIRDLEAMDPRQPYPVKLLGEDLVVWKDPKSGEWKAFADRCPHRWAPLSEGRVDQESGRLHCVYHGWEFEGDGTCGKIPLASDVVRENAQGSRRSCATVLQTKIVQGKLWLWPDASADGVEASKHSSPAVVEEIEDSDFDGNWYSRDLAYGYDTLVENLFDPAHVPFAHHGVIGNRMMGVKPMEIAMEKRLGPDEYRTEPTGYFGALNTVVGFKAPCLVYYIVDSTKTIDRFIKSAKLPTRIAVGLRKMLKMERRLAMKPEERKEPSDRILTVFAGYGVPTSPGRCRIFTRTARNFSLELPFVPKSWTDGVVNAHLAQHNVLDGDSYLLHVQERSLLREGKHGVPQPERTFYMPASTDTTVRAFRQWYNTRAGGSPTWPAGVDPLALGPVLTRREALDRFDAHTKHCSACSKAYRVRNQLKRISAGSALVLLAAAAAVPRGALSFLLAGGAMASSGLAVAMAKRAQKFIFVDYVHYPRD